MLGVWGVYLVWFVIVLFKAGQNNEIKQNQILARNIYTGTLQKQNQNKETYYKVFMEGTGGKNFMYHI